MPGSARPQLRVLVVDDDEDTAETLAEVLNLNGYSCCIARSSLEAVSRAYAFGPDIVLCDLAMPETDGFAFARRLRSEPLFRRTRLVALSGCVVPGTVERATEAGFDSHVRKPADIGQLLELLGQGGRSTEPPME